MILSGIHTVGDNSNGQLWSSRFKLSPRFIESDLFPCNYKSLISISAWNQSIAIIEQGSRVYFKQGNQEIETYEVGLAKKIHCLDKCAIVLLTNNTLLEVPSMSKLKARKCIEVDCSNNFIVYIDSKNRAMVIKGDHQSDPEILADNVTVIGCTNDAIFYAQSGINLFKFEGNETVQIRTPKQIASITCSEDDALFIDVEGNLYKYDFSTITQIFGLPQIAACAIGPQHSAAISLEGWLFTWGFNPSGQLGIGNDRPTTEPTCVLYSVINVVCGTHHTLVICSPNETPKIPSLMNKASLKSIPSALPQSQRRITKAELLS